MALLFCKATLKQFTLNSEERLKSRKAIDAVFANGLSVAAFPIRLVWVETPLHTKYKAQIAVSVPKRNFKHAVDRNLLKRRMREAYRKNKHIVYNFLEPQNKQYALMLIYTGRKTADYQEIENKLIITLQKFTERCNETPVADTNTGIV